MATMKTRIQNKHDTSDNWMKATSFIPLKGEIIVYDDLGRIKIGDGINNVNRLPFADTMDLPPLMGTSTPANIWDICHLSTSEIDDILNQKQLCKFTVDNLILEGASGSVISAHNLGSAKTGIFFNFPNQVVSIHVWGVCCYGTLENLNITSSSIKNVTPTKFDIRWNCNNQNFDGSIDTIMGHITDATKSVVPFLGVPDKYTLCIGTQGVEDTAQRSCIISMEIYFPSSGSVEKDKTTIEILRGDVLGESYISTNEMYDTYTYNVHSANLESFLGTSITSAVSSNTSIVKTSGAQTISGVKTFSSLPVCSTTPTSSSQLVNKSYVDGNFVSTGSSAQTITGIKTFAQTGTNPPIKIINNIGSRDKEELYIYSNKLWHCYGDGVYEETLNLPYKGGVDPVELTLATTSDLVRAYEKITRSTSSLTSTSYSSNWIAKSINNASSSNIFKKGRTVIFQISSGPYNNSSPINKSVFIWYIDQTLGAQNSWLFCTETSTSSSFTSLGIDGAVVLAVASYEGTVTFGVKGRNANSTPIWLEYWVLGE